MVFSSQLFLFVFLPIVVVGYFLLDQHLKNFWLLLASLFFYSWGEPRYILLMLVSVIVNYLFAFAVADQGRRHKKNPVLRKLWMTADVLINLGMLGYFKYFNFLAENIDRVMDDEVLAIREIALPIGISFYTFQAMSYVIDVYRGKVKVQRSVTRLALYISFFPQLIAGPIVRYADIEKEISNRKVSLDDFYAGSKRFMLGFSKKILIADQLAPLVDSIFEKGGMSILPAWVGAIAYTLQIYFDFSGYSDMAIGIGKMLGFHFPENFNYPYLARSVRDFWRRWHISLSGWFRDYVYIPLGGSRKSEGRTCLNLIVVFFLTGLWHGASWNFIVWGLYYAVFLVLERLLYGNYLDKKSKVSGHIYSLIVIVMGWVFFRAENLLLAVEYIGNMFTFRGDSYRQLAGQMNLQYVFCLITGAVLSLPILSKADRFLEKIHLGILSDLFVILVFLAAIAYLYGKGFSPFLYFRF